MITNKTNSISIKSKALAQIAAGVFGGTILGIAMFLIMINFGSRYGCGKFIDSIFGTAGYESCSSFGSIVGVLLGVVLGMVAIGKSKIITYSKAALWLGVGALLLPFIYGVVMFLPEFENGNIFGSLLMISTAVISFAIASAVPSIFIAWIINWQNSRKA